MVMPYVFIALGVIFLLENLNLIPTLNWSIIWPALLIFAGFYMLKKRSGNSCCNWNWGGVNKEEKK